jgi:hypothetical protein
VLVVVIAAVWLALVLFGLALAVMAGRAERREPGRRAEPRRGAEPARESAPGVRVAPR